MPNIKKCERCNGNKGIWVEEILINPISKKEEKRKVWRVCPICRGRGWQ
jgi:hypothetical protein